jgi:hypothetical protein
MPGSRPTTCDMVPDPRDMNDRNRDGETGQDAPSLGEVIEAAASDAEAYLSIQQALIKLELSERGGRFAAKIVWYIAALLLVGPAIGLLAVALGLHLGRLFQDSVLGFLAAGGAFLLLAVLFYLLWRWVLRDRITLAIINAAHAQPERFP